MNETLNGWFTELSPMWPGQAFSLKIKKLLCDKTSKFQDIKIFESTQHGKVLTLDGIIQCTEFDESSYQEMISFLPLNSHPNPEKVLVIGGGDGGVLREVSKHPRVKKIYHCEIDAEVIEACKIHIPSMSCGFSSDKLVRQITGDGSDFLENTEEHFDVIITDTSDPVVTDSQTNGTKNGPAISLFDDQFYSRMKSKLKSGGILCCQGENMWYHRNLIFNLMKQCRNLYPVVNYAYTCTPTYPGGQIGFILCSLNPETNFSEPITTFSEEESLKLFKYYSADIHRAAFVLPNFMKKGLKQ